MNKFLIALLVCSVSYIIAEDDLTYNELDLETSVEEDTWTPSEPTNELTGEQMPSDISRIDADVQLSQGDAFHSLASDVDMCYSVGDPHSRSFDGQVFHFQGIGQMLLSQSSRMMVQARNYVCGASSYYGVVGCYEGLAVRYYSPSTNKADIIEVYLKPGYPMWIKVNGKLVPQSIRTQTGVDVYKYDDAVTQYDAAARRNVVVKYPNVAIRTPVGSGVNIGWGAVYIYERRGTTTNGLCGNHNGNPNDDLKSYDGKKTYVCRQEYDCVDSNPAKDVHKWGMSYMVQRGNTIPNIFSTPIAGVDQPSLGTAPAEFASEALKARAQDYCRTHAKSYDFYFDCMFDAAKSGSLAFSRMDSEVSNIVTKMKSNGRYHAGRTQLLDLLSEMDVNLGIEKAKLEEQHDKIKGNVNTLTARLAQNKKDETAACTPVPPAKANVKTTQATYDRLSGDYSAALSDYNANVKQWTHIIESNKVQRDLIAQMLKTLANLVNVKDLSELDIDHEKLDQYPKLKHTFTELIDRAHKGYTDVVEKLLKDLLKKLGTEIDQSNVAIKNGKTRIDTLLSQKTSTSTSLTKYRSTETTVVNSCDKATRDRAATEAALEAAKKVDAKEALGLQTKIDDLRTEIEMAQDLKRSITAWATAKDTKEFKPCVSDLEEALEENEEDDDGLSGNAVWEAMADAIPVHVDGNAAAALDTSDIDAQITATAKELNLDL